MTTDIRIERANHLYERAVFTGDTDALTVAEVGLDAAEADLALARGRLVHARYLDDRVEDARELELFERAAELYAELGDARGEGEALFWIGAFHQVVREDGPTALPAFERALELATRAGDRLTVSYVLRHLGFAEQYAGRPEAALPLFEESTRLRRELDFRPGVAANLIALAHVAADQQRPADATALLAEADALAAACEAHAVRRWVTEARERLDLP
ncbi:tetratricopeptide repeat protein [Kitasatospora terrestris]|uniref:Tetratricopeptide repeat protein n=1 Tax=Kitasatospora terrestris TaxID=258051 RepID=A0ABP9EJ96_9ACTN